VVLSDEGKFYSKQIPPVNISSHKNLIRQVHCIAFKP